MCEIWREHAKLEKQFCFDYANMLPEFPFDAVNDV